jgi:hypothetical protein
VSEKTERYIVQGLVGILAMVAILSAFMFTIPRHGRMPSVALGQPDLYRVEVCLALFYGGLLVLTPLFYGVLRGTLPSEISQQGAKWPQAANAANVTLDELDVSVKRLQRDMTIFRAKLVETEVSHGPKAS